MSERIKHKVRCLLELAKQSQFPNEAQAAKTQALALMRRYNLSKKDLRPTPIQKPTITPEQNYADTLIELLKYKKQLQDLEEMEARFELKRKKRHKQFMLHVAAIVVGWIILSILIILFVPKG